MLLALQDPNLSKLLSQGGYMEGSMGMTSLSQPELAHASAVPEAGMQAGRSAPAKAQLLMPSLPRALSILG